MKRHAIAMHMVAAALVGIAAASFSSPHEDIIEAMVQRRARARPVRAGRQVTRTMYITDTEIEAKVSDLAMLNDADTDLVSTGASDLPPSTVVQAASRSPRSVHDDCLFTPQQANKAATLTARAAFSHAFPRCGGGLTVFWNSDDMGEMLIVTQQPNTSRSLFVSTDGGRTFNAADINDLIFTASWASTKNADGKFNALASAFPLNSTFNQLYVSSDVVRGNRTWSPLTLSFSGSGPKALYNFMWTPNSVFGNRAVLAFNYLNSSLVFWPYFVDTQGNHQAVLLLPDNGVGLAAKSAEWSTADVDLNATGGPGKIYILTTSGEVWPQTIVYDEGSDSFSTSTEGRISTILNTNDFYQIGKFAFAEFTSRQNGLTHLELKVATDGNTATWRSARVPIDSEHTTNAYEILYANEDEVMMAARHTHNRVQGVANVDLTSNGRTTTYTASRALFSEVLPETPPAPMRMFYDANNANGCSDNFTNPPQERFVLVAFRGECYFVEKLQNAIDVGAAGVIVINHATTGSVYMSAPEGHDTSAFGSIPMLLVSRQDGCSIFQRLGADADCDNSTVRSTALENEFVSLYENETNVRALFNYTKLYTSGNQGVDFSKSLADVRLVPSDGIDYVDVFEVSSLPGAFIANVARNTRQSFISHNKGATWSGITDVNGLPLLISIETYNAAFGYPLPTAVSTAPGLVVANALGNHSTERIPSVYISRDGGLSWRHSIPPNLDRPQPFFFQVLDHGSVVVMSQFGVETNSTYFSLNEGAHVVELPLDGLRGITGKWKMDDACGTTTTTYDPDVTFDCYPYDETQVVCKREGDVNLFMIPHPDEVGKLTWSTLNGQCCNRKPASGTTCDASAVTDCRHSGAVRIVWKTTGQATTDQCWKRAAAEPKIIRGIVADPRATGTSVFIYWFDQIAPAPLLGDWAGVRVDYSDALTNAGGQCTDYRDWIPTGSSAPCDLGSRTTYQRKYQCEICRNGRAHTLIKQSVPCQCASYDYACGYGWLRPLNARGDAGANETEQCTRDVDVDHPSTQNRLIPGDVCCLSRDDAGCDTPGEGGQTTAMPGLSTGGNGGGGGGGGGGTVVAIVLIIVAASMLGGAYKLGYLNRFLTKSSGSKYQAVGGALSINADINNDIDDDDDDDDELVDEEMMA